MNIERVTFGFFIILALTFSVVFVAGDIDNPDHHDVWVLTIAIVVNLIATGLKLGDRSNVGALLLATALVADLLLIGARVVWIVADTEVGPDADAMATIVSLGYGAVVANVVSVAMVVGDTLMSRR